MMWNRKKKKTVTISVLHVFKKLEEVMNTISGESNEKFEAENYTKMKKLTLVGINHRTGQ